MIRGTQRKRNVDVSALFSILDCLQKRQEKVRLSDLALMCHTQTAQIKELVPLINTKYEIRGLQVILRGE
jgi:hypothetical protein